MRAAHRRATEVVLRRGLLLIVLTAAVTAVLAGLARLGVVVAWGSSNAVNHGALFALGVFGTVIALERAVALGGSWALFAPAAGAGAAVAMLLGLRAAPWLAVSSNLALLGVNVAIVRRQAAPFTWLILAGSAVLLLGTSAWALGRLPFQVVPTWIAFLVLTIVAERLELSRLAPTPRWATRMLLVLACGFALTACASLWEALPARSGFGAMMAGLAAWQLRFDLARRTLRKPGLPRFAALGVLLGALWLLSTGVLFATTEIPPAGPVYDAAVHGVFVGYVLSMVFAHAPIVLPAVAKVHVPFHPLLYVPLAVLHVGLLARVLGDWSGTPGLRQAGALANAVAPAMFAAVVILVRSSQPSRQRAT